MATLRNVTLSIVRDVANADITVDFDVDWSPYDQLTNLQYSEVWRLFGDDTDEDGDETLTPGDDSIDVGLIAVGKLSSNGQTTSHRTKTVTIAYDGLNEDNFASPATGDDEIRALVTLTPLLPVATSRESNRVVVNA